MIIEYLDRIGYRNGYALDGFLISLQNSIEEIRMSAKKIVLLGAGDNERNY